ncbi:AAA family ATPase [Granulosicoccus antarcticus]|uniref:ATPase RavA n=1 Tax=Granulosicoccus antarcticus IMCC3135 TaxID=1192854 RepID=A0A2Z2NWW9_9GAMM|nr:MoxR family ATPase [Granulosicoccus antarcticus]ASJ74248.1 ATPase RavA [Granulosicoccus antarcticus IMCC3135]
MKVGIDEQQAPQAAFSALQELRATLGKQLVGLEPLIDRLLIALLTGGHLLIEGPPGVAKTRTINRFAQLLNVRFARIQATPDLLPADITGTDMFQQQSGEFKFHAGPLFNHIVLVDEVNRAPPKVQSALLEAMGEHQITTNGVTRKLEEPFMVAATQNPIEYEGTYPLPEAQLDRFMFFVTIDLPGIEQERMILDQVLSEPDALLDTPKVAAIGDRELILQARQAIPQVFLSEAVRDYIVRLVSATRGHGAGAAVATGIAQAASPRASINLAIASRAAAWLDGRDFVTPDDVVALAPDILCGRIALDYRARAAGKTTRQLVNELLDATPRV